MVAPTQGGCPSPWACWAHPWAGTGDGYISKNYLVEDFHYLFVKNYFAKLQPKNHNFFFFLFGSCFGSVTEY